VLRDLYQITCRLASFEAKSSQQVYVWVTWMEALAWFEHASWQELVHSTFKYLSELGLAFSDKELNITINILARICVFLGD